MKQKAQQSVKSGREISAFIGLGTEFQGQLLFDGVIRLDGRFSGEINSSGTLIIGESAHVSAEIKVDTVIVSGEVHGNIIAKNRVDFHAPAKLYGNIISPVLTIDEGVLFEGSCDMGEMAGGKNGEAAITLMSKEDELTNEEDGSQPEHEII